MADPRKLDIKGPVTLTINGEHLLDVTNFRATPRPGTAPARLPIDVATAGSFSFEMVETDRAMIERIEAALFQPVSRYWARRTEYHRRRMNRALRRGAWLERVLRYVARAHHRRP